MSVLFIPMIITHLLRERGLSVADGIAGCVVASSNVQSLIRVPVTTPELRRSTALQVVRSGQTDQLTLLRSVAHWLSLSTRNIQNIQKHKNINKTII